MSRRRMMLGNVSSGGGLPSEYQQVEWIGHSKTTGTRIIIPRSNTGYLSIRRLETEIAIPSTTSNNPVVFGGLNGGNSGTSPYFDLQGTLGNITCTPTKSNVADITQKTLYAFQVTGTYNLPTEGYCAWGWDGSTFTTSIRGYSIKVYNSNNDLIFEGIPCYRKSDNAIGLWDTVSKNFFSGSGTWTKGSDI